MSISVPRYTVADLEGFPMDGNRYELLDGVLLVTPAPEGAHQLVVSRLQYALSHELMRRDVAEVVGPGVVMRAPGTWFEPDLLVVPAGSLAHSPWHEIREHWLAVEVFSPSSRIYDRDFKRNAYFALGVQQVWLVDIDARSIEVCTAFGVSTEARNVIRWRAPSGTDVSVDLNDIFRGL